MVNAILIFSGIIVGIFLFFTFPTLKKGSGVSKKTISIIIPARNEEFNLPNLLADLKKQTLAVREIICVNDNSEDRTSEVIKSFNITELKSKPLPGDWKGKTWACQQGAAKATGELLLFIDADVRLAPDAVETLLSQYKGKNHPISVQPYHKMKKKFEHFSLFFNVVQTCVTGLTVFMKKKHFGFYGPVMMIDRDLFNQNKGYEVVKHSVIEDYNLGKYYNKLGIHFKLLLGGDKIQFRMYSVGIKQVVEGWSKNFSSGSLASKWWIGLLVFAWISAYTSVPFELGQNIIDMDVTYIIALAITYALSVILLYRTSTKIGSYPFLVSLFFPVYLLFFHFVFFTSILKTFVFKSITWKGRKV